MSKIDQLALKQFIVSALQEDIQDGDHTSLACIPVSVLGSAQLKVKADGIICGIPVAKTVFELVDPDLEMFDIIEEGSKVKYGDIAFHVKGSANAILQAERVALNLMQRMSGIATLTSQYVTAIEGTRSKVIDTRKTTPNLRFLEKYAVTIGGGANHRMGLYDMIMIKDNHIDFCGGISKALDAANAYLEKNNLHLKIEIETRNIEEVKQVIQHGKADRIMLDNYTPEQMKPAVELIGGRFETEASGGINLQTIRSYAETGVDFISVGALTHSAVAFDLSLKAEIGK
ncbi:MAG: carboxylating nicotinate-nucleotide diphosphorylase [Chitinophagales bacterium]|nr:carboxylating nicotinate-nucleotide diphosphorylase [Chitinophagales bacterium]